MKKIFLVLFLIVSVSYGKQSFTSLQQNDVYLLPKESKQVKGKILDLIKKSQNSIYIAMYNFSYKKIARELIAASKKGVDVKVLFDKSKVKKDDTLYKYMRKNGVETIVTKDKLHTKMAIFDSKIVLIGSMNWTKESFKENYEVVLFTKDQKVVKKLENFIKNY